MPLDFSALDTRIAAIQVRLRTAQDPRDANGGRYSQIRDRDDEWQAIGVSVQDRAGLKCETHEYLGPRGKGWVTIHTAFDGKDVWQRMKHRGPEPERFQDPVVDARDGSVTWVDRPWAKVPA